MARIYLTKQNALSGSSYADKDNYFLYNIKTSSFNNEEGNFNPRKISILLL